MPWYWTDDLAGILRGRGGIEAVADTASRVYPQGLRAEADTIEEAADELLESGEIPLAA